MMHKKKMSSSGFTMIEAMIVVAVIGIMAGIAMPGFIGWLPNYRLRSDARDVVSCLQEMKLRAVSENSNVVVIFDLPGGTYQSFVDDGVDGGGNPNPNEKDSSEIVLKNGVLYETVQFLSSTFNSSTSDPLNCYFGFNSRGLPSAGAVGGEIQLQSSNSKTIAIVVNSAGNIRVE